VGNYVIVSPSELGNYVSADTDLRGPGGEVPPGYPTPADSPERWPVGSHQLGHADRGDLGTLLTTGSTDPVEFITPETERCVPAAYQPSPPAPAGESLAAN